MLSRSDSLVFTLPASTFSHHHHHHQLDFRPTMQRNKEPEIFTFERLPPHHTPPPAPTRMRKRNTRVMYPSQVRKYLPPAEKNLAKRWLLVLCLVVCLQIYTEEGCEAPGEASYNLLPIQSADQQARQMIPLELQHLHSGPEEKLNATSCQEEEEEVHEPCPQQSRRHGYVVALLYPVYHHHRLASEN